MLRRVPLLVFVMVALLLAAACSSPDAAVKKGDFDVTGTATNWASLQRSGNPRDWLLAPPDLAPVPGMPDQAPPVYPVSAQRLADAWAAVVRAQPRATIVAVSDDGLRIDSEQRSRLMGFVDRIAMRAVPVDDNRATLAVYSRATIGYYDFGVNRRRVEAWLAELAQRLEQTPAASPPR